MSGVVTDDDPDFGTDLSCVTDFTDEGRVVSGLTLISEALLRRWSSPRGCLLDDADYGTDLREFLNEDVDQLALVRIKSEARAEALKEVERVLDCVVLSAAFDLTTNRIVMSFEITLVTGHEYRLTISITDVSVTALSVEP